MGVKPADDPIYFDSPEALRDWFDANHQVAAELWVGQYRKATGRRSVSWSEAVDEALCVGWIDGVRYSVDDERFMQRFTPRRKGSNWSAVNIAKVAELTAAGRMRPAGLVAFEARTAARSAVYSYEQRRDATLEPDEEARFRSDESAWAWFSARPPSFRKQALHWVIAAKRPQTRQRRLATLIEDSAAGRPIKPMTYARKGAPDGAANPAGRPSHRASDEV
jgi:uncharacterized protein YdeI (YjbR/CyaY-like superfamily)